MARPAARVLILGIASTYDVHPAEIGHVAVDFALEHMEACGRRFRP